MPRILSKQQRDAEANEPDLFPASGVVADSTSRPPAGESTAIAGDKTLALLPDETLQCVQRLAGVGSLTAGTTQELADAIGYITTACANLLDRLDAGDLDSGELSRTLMQIEQNAYRSARIVEVLGNYSNDKSDKGSRGRDNEVAITSPAAVVQDARIPVEHQFRRQSGILIETFLDPGLTTIFGDHNALTQVLVNLLMNACDAMEPDGGVIRIRFWVPDPTLEWLPGFSVLGERTTEQFGDLFAFSVTDSGEGINADFRDRIFEPFFTTRHDGRHAGLGLAIARRIVESHHGQIWATSDSGGTTMTVVMPRRVTNNK